MSASLCDRCVGLCCRYFALPIDNPKTVTDFDNIRWYLCHENVVVFVEEKQWYIGILNRCKHLTADFRCGIYHERPRICRGYSTSNCDYHGDEYVFEHLFTSAEQLRVWAEAHLSKKRGRKVRLVAQPPPGKTIVLPAATENGSSHGVLASNGQSHTPSQRIRSRELPVLAPATASVNGAQLQSAPRVRRKRSTNAKPVRRSL
jgi:Fe-S-cluster containining protein